MHRARSAVGFPTDDHSGSVNYRVDVCEKTMGQLVVRNIEDVVKARLQRRAKRHGRSMEEERPASV
jgi:Antitoxin FitA-like, ribbon-helix-helix